MTIIRVFRQFKNAGGRFGLCVHDAPGGTRTPNLGVRSASLYPLEPLGHWYANYSIENYG